MAGDFCVYILECNDGTLYTGYTNDLDKRFLAHQQGKGAKYTRGRTPVKLVYHEKHESKSAALKAEYRIKKLNRIQKERLIYVEEHVQHVEAIQLPERNG